MASASPAAISNAYICLRSLVVCFNSIWTTPMSLCFVQSIDEEHLRILILSRPSFEFEQRLTNMRYPEVAKFMFSDWFCKWKSKQVRNFIVIYTDYTDYTDTDFSAPYNRHRKLNLEIAILEFSIWRMAMLMLMREHSSAILLLLHAHTGSKIACGQNRSLIAWGLVRLFLWNCMDPLLID